MNPSRSKWRWNKYTEEKKRKEAILSRCRCPHATTAATPTPPPARWALTSFYSQSIGHISYYTLPLTYTSSCSYTHATQTETRTPTVAIKSASSFLGCFCHHAFFLFPPSTLWSCNLLTSPLQPHRRHNRGRVFFGFFFPSLVLFNLLKSSRPVCPPSLLLLFHTTTSSSSSSPSCSSPLIFHFAALLLISQSACGLTELRGSDGGCQTVSTYLFTMIHTCIHLTCSKEQGKQKKDGNNTSILLSSIWISLHSFHLNMSCRPVVKKENCLLIHRRNSLDIIIGKVCGEINKL